MSEYSNAKVQWPEHFSNGGTGVTKTSGDETRQITESVFLFNDPEIYMVGSELHCSRKRVDLSNFWKFHRERPKNKTNNSTVEEKMYLKNHEQSGFQIGDKVRLIRCPKKNELGWACRVCEGHGGDFIDKTLIIKEDRGAYGFGIYEKEENFSGKLFPYFVLELVEKRKNPKPIISLCAGIANTYSSDSEIQSEELHDLIASIETELGKTEKIN